MKKIFFVMALVALGLTFAADHAAAQNTGTVNITGQVAKAAAIRWWTFTAVNSGVGTNTPAIQNGPLSLALDVADVAAGNNLDNYTGGVAQLIVRSNTPYNLTADVTASSGFGVVANGDVALSDVGYGIANLTNSGAKVFLDPATNSTIAAGYNNDPATAPKDVDEEPIFSIAIDSVVGGVQVLSGPRISNRGGIGSPNNGLLVDTTYSIGPQFYSPTNPISATVTYTLATP